MMHDVELLQYIYKTADMGCSGIKSIIDSISGEALKNELKAQYNEYEKICGEAQSMLKSRNEEPKGVGTVAKMSADIMSAGQMMMDRSDSKIAEMTIKGNQTGMNKTIKHLHDYSGRDADVKALAEKLLSTEESNAKQLEKYL